MCKRLHWEYEQSFYGIALQTIQIPGLTPTLKRCSRDGRQFATLILSDVEGIKWEIAPTHWMSLAQKQSEQRVSATWKIAPIQRSEHEIPNNLCLYRRKTDGCKGFYDSGESATGTFESVRDLLDAVVRYEQEERGIYAANSSDRFF